MKLHARIIFLLTIIGAIAAAGYAQTDESADDPVTAVRALSDSAFATLVKAIAEQDSALFVSVFPEDIEVAMPSGTAFSGRDRIAKYTKLVFEHFGGARLERNLIAFGLTPDREDMVRDGGTLAIKQDAADSTALLWAGAYTAYWHQTDSTWHLDRLFIGYNRP